MKAFNFFALGIVLVYSLVFMLLFKRFDDYLRKTNCSYRKSLEIAIAIIHTLIWWVLGCYYEEYMSYMVPPTIPALAYSIQIAYGKIKF